MGVSTPRHSSSDPLAALAALSPVAEAVAAAGRAVDSLRSHPALRSGAQHVATESALRGAHASAALEGAWSPRADVRSGAALAVPSGEVVKGAVRVSTAVPELTRSWGRAPFQVLARLHVLAAADVVPPAQLGRPRTGTSETEVADPLASCGGSPGLPGAPELSRRLDGLLGLLGATTAAPALVLAAVVHGELMVLRPFGWGNGLVARAAVRLVLRRRGLDPQSLVAAEVGHLELGPAAYGQALRGYAEGGADGVAGWVAHCADAVALGARDGVAVCEARLRR